MSQKNGEFSPAALQFLTKFQSLDKQNKEFEVENAALRDRLAAENNQTNLARDLQQNASEQFDKFRQELISMGACTTMPNAREVMEELFRDVQLQEVQISKVGTGVLQKQYSVLRVHLLANIAGSEHCLFEHDRFNLHNGQRQILMTPLEVRLRVGETWQDAVKRGLHLEVGLLPEWQDNYVVIDESSHISLKEESAENILGFVECVQRHEVHVRLKACSRSQDEEVFETIGLPSGRDFVFCEQRGRSTVHVWCWKSREYECSARLSAFENYLKGHGVDTAGLGKGGNKTLFQMYQEVKEQKDSSLVEISPRPVKGKVNLQRVVQILELKLVAEVNKCKRVLTASEQSDSNRQQCALPGSRLVVRPLRDGEQWQAVLPEAIYERFGIDVLIQNECLTVDQEKMIYTEEVVAAEGFGGIESKYMIRTLTVSVADPDHEALECIGLPRGNDFISKEFSSSGQADLHVWTWALAADDQDVAGNFTGTALEVLHRGLADVESMLVSTISDARLATAGLAKPFETSLQKLKQCVARLANIDKTVSSVDVKTLMGRSDDPVSPGGRSNEVTETYDGLQGFIASNFTRAEDTGVESAFSPKASSRIATGAAGGFTPASLQDFSLETLFASSPPLLKNIMEGRNQWDLDFFALASECESPQSMLEGYGEVMIVPFCVHAFACTEISARSFVQTAASQYMDNPYHGHCHAAQVCHLSRWLTKAHRIMELQSELESTAFIIAAMCHDIKHFGRNNAFCITTEHPLALLYGNAAVMENYHSASCLQLLESMQVLQQLSLKDRALVRSHIIENILATDMAEHFEVISKFRVRLESSDWSTESEPDRRFTARFCLKAGDLGHACLPWEIHTQWCYRVLKEFYSQGDHEKAIGLPISALCDRKDINSLEKSQQGFLQFVVSPLYVVLVESQPPPKEMDEPEKPRPPTTHRRRMSNAGKRRSSVMETEQFVIETNCSKVLNSNAHQWGEDAARVEKIKATLWADSPPNSPQRAHSR